MKRVGVVLGVAVVMAAAVLVATGMAVAQTAPPGTLDAENLNQQPNPDSMAGISTQFANGQTFTVTRSGEITGARVLIQKRNSPEDLTVMIAKVDAGTGRPAVPEEVVASTTIPASTIPPGDFTVSSLQPLDFVFDTPVPVVAGERYALILKAKGDAFTDFLLQTQYLVGMTGDPFLNVGDTYPGGERIFQFCPFGTFPNGASCATSQWSSGGVTDLMFGIYIDDAPPDTTPPEISSTDPANNATGVPATANISATFFEEGSGMDPDTLTESTFKVVRVKPTGNIRVSGDVSYDEDSQTATFDPANSLAKGRYRATLTTGIADKVGNSLADKYTWKFATVGPLQR